MVTRQGEALVAVSFFDLRTRDRVSAAGVAAAAERFRAL
jgi:hypothetical protein